MMRASLQLQLLRTWEHLTSAQALERLLFLGIISQYALYYIGLAPLIPLMIVWPAISLGICQIISKHPKLPYCIAIIWLICMAGLLIQALVNFYTHGMGGTYVARWIFNLGLASLLPLIGMLINSTVLYKAASYLGIQTLIYAIVVIFATTVQWNIDRTSFLPENNILPVNFLHITLFVQETFTTGENRALAFTPYATYAGVVSCFYLLLCIGDTHSPRKYFGIMGWILLLFLTHARAALICALIGVAVYFLLSLKRQYLLLLTGAGLVIAALSFQHLVYITENTLSYIESRRISSSNVRHNLRQIAYNEWKFGGNSLLGTGRTIPGGAVVADMPIGSHDTYNANLMIRGAVGFCLLFFPIIITLIYAVSLEQTVATKIAISGLLLLLIYAYVENLESLYMYLWPFLLFLGCMTVQNRPQNI